MRFDTLLRILDGLISEAPPEQKRYRPDKANPEALNQARSRALIHLYLKVMFGETNFEARERTITDGANDAGIDGYYIQSENQTIYLIQSKFRTNSFNFERKEIELSEILSMEIDRVISGEETSEGGVGYNGKIKQLQREISQISDVARYKYKIILLANLTQITPQNLRKLADGYPVEVFNHERTYQSLVFPVITGNYFTASDIVIPIDLSNKNAGSKISYNVKTKFSDCEITVLFVPTLEVAKMMHKYKNAILQFNPRSYLEFQGQNVNEAIRRTILHTDTNEFALFNNGLTMLSDETNINEKIGQKNKAQLRIKNPQIINGGQTSFTLSRIYSENIDRASEIFADKEVLLKVITVIENDSEQDKLSLIDEISNATNKQTPVINADRFANEEIHKTIQEQMFERYGLLYERKRGEFSDGINDGYVEAKSIIERNEFWRICFASNGSIQRGFEKKLFQRNDFSSLALQDAITLDRTQLGIMFFRKIRKKLGLSQRRERAVYALTYAYVELFFGSADADQDHMMEKNIGILRDYWAEFFGIARKNEIDRRIKPINAYSANPVILSSVDFSSLAIEPPIRFNISSFMSTGEFEKKLTGYFKEIRTSGFPKIEKHYRDAPLYDTLDAISLI